MLEITIRTQTDAFAEGCGPYEAARILREIADRIETGRTDGKVRDLNGNTVGQWSIAFPDEESGQ